MVHLYTRLRAVGELTVKLMLIHRPPIMNPKPMICVDGKTYEHRQTLKEIGLKWQPRARMWCVELSCSIVDEYRKLKEELVRSQIGVDTFKNKLTGMVINAVNSEVEKIVELLRSKGIDVDVDIDINYSVAEAIVKYMLPLCKK